MPEEDLRAIWSVLQTEAAGPDAGIEAAPSGTSVLAGDVLLGVDNESRRILLIPLRAGEAFAEDNSGRSVHIGRVAYGGITYLSVMSLNRELDEVFTQFAKELLVEIVDANSPAQATIDALARWRRLFSEISRAGRLSEHALIGLLAELLTLESLLLVDPQRKIGVWTGPNSSQHDFRSGSTAIEVKGTLAREGRIVPISSVDQLQEPPSGRLFLAHYRFEPDPSGLTVPSMVTTIRDLGVEPGALNAQMSLVGYRDADAGDYESLRYRIVDRRVYDVDTEAFPRIIPSSFSGGVVPPGTLRISYSIDLTNDPPTPLDEASIKLLFESMAA